MEKLAIRVCFSGCDAAAYSWPQMIICRSAAIYAFLKAHWGSLEKAWEFERSHDSDGDGIYENIAGSGWVESWPPGMPHQEIYLAALDQQASTAFAKLARATGDAELAANAEKRASTSRSNWKKNTSCRMQTFTRSAGMPMATLDTSPTIYPAVAAWDGTFTLSHASAMLNRWASPEFSTDWGTRDLSPSVSFYDPISYHQGSVWPLFTGWVSLSEYRNGRSLSGYAHLMQNADLTWAENLGAITELLSGEFFRWLGREHLAPALVVSHGGFAHGSGAVRTRMECC